MPPIAESPQSHKATGLRAFAARQYQAAAEAFQAGAALCAAGNDQAGQAEMLNNLGVTWRALRRCADGQAALEQASTLFAGLEDAGNQGQTLANLGDLLAGCRQWPAAVQAYSQGAALLAQAGDRARQSQVLRALSLGYLRRGALFLAMTLMEQSLAVRPHLGPGRWLFRALLRLVLHLGGGR